MKISQLPELTTIPAAGDLLPVVDVSDLTSASTGTTKKISFTNLVSASLPSDIFPRWRLTPGTIITVPSYRQYLVQGPLVIDAGASIVLDPDAQLAII